jgi:hypothetical protein
MILDTFFSFFWPKPSPPDPTKTRDYTREEVKNSFGQTIIRESWWDIRRQTKVYRSTPVKDELK